MKGESPVGTEYDVQAQNSYMQTLWTGGVLNRLESDEDQLATPVLQTQAFLVGMHGSNRSSSLSILRKKKRGGRGEEQAIYT